MAEFAGNAGVERAATGAPGRTGHGVVLGTPGYMSPEQARGEVERVDERSDIYALGAILRFLVSSKGGGEGVSGQMFLPRPLPGDRIFCAKVNSLLLGIPFGVAVGFLLAFLVAYLQHGYYFEIILPGSIVGLIVGFATQRYGAAAAQVAR